MEDTEEHRKGEFVWHIYNFLKSDKEYEESPEFKFGKHDLYLQISKIYDDNDDGYDVCLCDSNDEWISSKTFYKLCFLDGRGTEFLVTKRTIVKFYNFITLMVFSNADLLCEENNDLLPEGVLTLHLSWCEAEDSKQERGTQVTSDLNPETEASKMLQTLSEHFGRYYESKVDTDFLLKVDEAMIPVHRAVLSARSEVFAAMFRHDTSENRSGVVDIPDVDVAVLSDVLYYVYSGQTRGMSADTICPMYVVADKYALIELREACLDFLMRNLTVENVCDAALQAHTHGETKLEEEVVQFVKEKLEEIEETDKWKELSKTKSSLALKLLRSALMIYKDKEKSSFLK